MKEKKIKKVGQEEIIQAFYEVAKSEGLENASMIKVAKSLEVDPNLILNYFNTREELLARLITFNLERYYKIFKNGSENMNDLDDLIQLIDDLFSRKWHELFDDSVFYSCYALAYRNEKIKKSFKQIHDILRIWLLEALQEAMAKGIIHNLAVTIEDAIQIIFILIEGAYYYLGLVYQSEEYTRKITLYKKQAFNILNIPIEG